MAGLDNVMTLMWAIDGPGLRQHTFKHNSAASTDMPRGRKKGDHDAKRVEIADGAYKVFLRLGLERTSLADIAREIGNTTGVLRHYFSDKTDLLLYAKNLLFDRSYVRAKEAADRCDGLEKIRAIMFELLPTRAENVDAYRLLMMFNGSAIGDPHLMKLQAKRNATHAELIAELIEALQQEGVIRKNVKPRLEAAAILALIDGLADQMVMRPNSWSKAEVQSLVDRQLGFLAKAS
jgi:AcrR family transcriptional regulator